MRDWISDELPNEKRLIVVYDVILGVHIGYFSALQQEFYTVNGTELRNVCAWFYVPDKPEDLRNLIGKIRNRNVILGNKR